MGNESENLINLFTKEDDDLHQFDPLSSFCDKPVSSSVNNASSSYSNDLLNFGVGSSTKYQQDSSFPKPKRLPPPPPQIIDKSSNAAASSTPDFFNHKTFTPELTSISTSQLRSKSYKGTTASNSNQGFVSYLSDSNNQSANNFPIKEVQPNLDRNLTAIKQPEKSSFVSYVSKNNHANHRNTSNSVETDGGLSHKSFSSNTVRDEFKSTEKLIELVMSHREDEFTSTRPFRIFVGTWNVNGRSPPDFVVEWTAADPDSPDLYVVGFQELDLSKEAFVFSESSREQEWLSAVEKSLHESSRYVLIKHVRLVGMMLLVFSLKCHQPHISHVESHQVGTGLLGRMGNKGGVGIRFDLHNTRICIVNSHLAAHAEMTQKRNEDFHEICSRLRFPDRDREGYLHIYQHDVLIWLGDLNYRIDRMHPDMVKEYVRKGDYASLKKYDQYEIGQFHRQHLRLICHPHNNLIFSTQLLCQQRDGEAFVGFQEGDIQFWPTYKYNPGTDSWDSSEKARTPAWCDRILWWEPTSDRKLKNKKRKSALELVEYRSHQVLKISDHKPVSALFDMNVKVINEDRYRKIYHEECRNMDRLENNLLPDITLNKQFLDFGTVKFHERSVQTIQLRNVGKAPCEFEFISKDDKSSFCRNWLMISKPKGFIIAGDQVEIELEVYINKSVVGDLNSGKEKIEDILILHLIGGKDYFISVSGNYLPSCFGTSLEALCRMSKPIRDVPQDELLALSKISPMRSKSSVPNSRSCPIPKELWQIVDHLYHNALTETGLFQRSGLHHDLLAIQQRLDTELPLPGQRTTLPGSNHSVAESLVVFLEILPEPVIPFSFYSGCLQVSNDILKAKEILNTLSLCHLQTFNYLITFLQELAKYQAENGLSVHIISTIFSGLMLRPSSRKSGIEVRIDRQKSKEFIELFLLSK